MIFEYKMCYLDSMQTTRYTRADKIPHFALYLRHSQHQWKKNPSFPDLGCDIFFFFFLPILSHIPTMSNRMLVLVGLPGSGKSTISNKLIQCRKVTTFPCLFWVCANLSTTSGLAESKSRWHEEQKSMRDVYQKVPRSTPKCHCRSLQFWSQSEKNVDRHCTTLQSTHWLHCANCKSTRLQRSHSNTRATSHWCPWKQWRPYFA